MFLALGLILSYSLFSFGAVLPNTWLLVAIFWLGALAVCVSVQAYRHGRLPLPLIAVFVVGVLLFALVQPKLAVGLIAAVWTWAAAGSDNSKRTIRFFHFLLLVGLFEATLGLVQFFISPGWIFGYTNPFFRSTGTLINRNHFAGLLEMLVPVPLGLAYISLRHGEGSRVYTYLLAAAFIGLALVFSLSRSGILSFVLTTMLIVFLLRLRDSKQRFATVLGLGLLAAVLAGALWIGLDSITSRYGELTAEDALVRDGRLIVFRDTIRMIQSNPGGIGVGQYQDRFRAYQTYHPDQLFDHAHNDYLETIAEWGTPIAPVFWIAIGFIFISAIRAFLGPGPPEHRGILLACIGAIFSILIHSLTDFNLQIPSNAMLFFAYVGLASAYALRQKSDMTANARDALIAFR